MLATALLIGIIGAGAGWFLVERARANLPEPRDLAELRPDYGTRVQAQDGTHLGGVRAVEPVAYENLPPKLVATFLAAEDEDFFLHDGYNARSIMRALFANYRAGRTVQGASTISQQVAKHFLSSERTWGRKIRELLLARQIEERFSKTEILEAYLGGVYFGENAWGVTQAAYTYFSVAPQELSVGQMATLAGLLPAPSVYNPVKNPQLAIDERNRVLRRMKDVGILSIDDYDTYIDEPLEGPVPIEVPVSPAPEAAHTVRRTWDNISDGRPWDRSDLEIVTTHHPGYQSLARQALTEGIEAHDRRRGFDGPPARANDASALDNALDGLTITGSTTLSLARVDAIGDEGLTLRIPDASIQLSAHELDWLDGIDPRTGDPRDTDRHWSDHFTVDDVVFVRRDDQDQDWTLWQWPIHQGALMVTDHHSGETLASIGAYDVERSQFHRAEQACRQPGSLFKTIVYAEAFSESITPATLLRDSPTDVASRDGVWQPRNADRDFRGYLTALDAYVASRNIPTVNLYQHLGHRRVIDRARNMGVQSMLDPGPSLALGASCTSVSEMIDVHAAIARSGKAHDRRSLALIRDISTGRVRDYGHFLQRDPAIIPRIVRAAARPRASEQVVDPDVNFLMSRALRDVVTRGTAHELPNAWPIGAKTGTSNEFDAWIAAVDPDHAAAVWVGSDRNTDAFGRSEHAGTVALPIFADFYDGLSDDGDVWPGEPAEELDIEEVFIDPSTGLRARSGEPGLVYPFLWGTAPTEYAPTGATRQLERFDSLVY